MPVAGGRLFVDLNNLGLPHAIFHRKLKLGSPSNAINLVVHLLDCFKPDHCKSSPWKPKIDAGLVRHNLAWILNGLQRLWSISFRWLLNADPDDLEDQARMCLQVLEHIGTLSDRGVFSLLDTQLAYGLLQILDEVLVLEHLSRLQILHLEVSRLIVKFADCIRDSHSLWKTTKQTIQQRFREIQRVPSLLQCLDPQLQVFCACHSPVDA